MHVTPTGVVLGLFVPLVSVSPVTRAEGPWRAEMRKWLIFALASDLLLGNLPDSDESTVIPHRMRAGRWRNGLALHPQNAGPAQFEIKFKLPPPRPLSPEKN
jgi:hypothetical protein